MAKKYQIHGKFTSDNAGHVVQDTAPEDTSVLWVDTSDNSSEENPGYATEQWVKDQNYLTEVPDGYAKTEAIPTDEHIIDLIEENAPESSSGGGVKQVTEWKEIINYTATAEDESSVSKFIWTSEDYPELEEARAFLLVVKFLTKSPNNQYRRMYLNDVLVTWLMAVSTGQMQQAYITPDGVVLGGTKDSTHAGLGSEPTSFGMRQELKTINSPVTKVEYNSWTTGLVTEGTTIQLYIAK